MSVVKLCPPYYFTQVRTICLVSPHVNSMFEIVIIPECVNVRVGDTVLEHIMCIWVRTVFRTAMILLGS